ncbi:MAG: hypothetical protein OHK93_005327 [Ramalina farinacea]|uniref:Uncharacterized protein n=1 Tax=Ramalina farinacea TaxID=258253 RepID=A0AA43QWE9_9LECA|nr:hypothetical protein [Ramalina farinacea]
MYSPLRLQLLALILLNHLLFIIALPTGATLNLPVSTAFNLSVSSASNNTTPLTSVNFYETVAQGIAAVQRAYPKIVPRLFDVGAKSPGKPQSLPLPIDGIALQLHITYPKILRTGYRASWGRWSDPGEQNAPFSFIRPDFDWDNLPLSFEDAQSKMQAAEDVPGDWKQFNSILIYVFTEHHPTLPIDMGELVYSFINRNEQGDTVYVVWVVARSGEVFFEERPQATAPVDTT